MRTPDEIRDVQFTKTTMGGYKSNEVDAFLEEIADQVEQMAVKMKEYDARNRELEKKAGEANFSPSGIQNILMAAQRVADEVERDAHEQADKTVAEAEARAAEITAKCDTLLAETRAEVEQQKAEADAQTTELIADAAKKVDAMTRAARDSVAREQLLFDKLQAEVVAFRKQITELFLAQAEDIKKLPDAVPFDPEQAAKALSFEPTVVPDFASFVNTEKAPEAEETTPVSDEPNKAQAFVDALVAMNDEDEEDENQLAFSDRN